MDAVRAQRLAEMNADAEVAVIHAEPEAAYAAIPRYSAGMHAEHAEPQGGGAPDPSNPRYVELQARRLELAQAAGEVATEHVRKHGFEMQDCRSTSTPF